MGEKAWAYCHECGYQGDLRPNSEYAELDVQQHDAEHHSPESTAP